MNQYTVLMLLPDHQRDDHPSDWLFRAHVEADDVDGALFAARSAWLEHNEYEHGDEWAQDQLATLAVYEGHLIDHYSN
jgi:hypothetical protein